MNRESSENLSRRCHAVTVILTAHVNRCTVTVSL